LIRASDFEFLSVFDLREFGFRLAHTGVAAHQFGMTPSAIGLALHSLAVNFLRMNLEDHVGDIIRKARGMSNVSAAAAARAAGLTEAELAGLEDSGQAPKKPNLTTLAELIGLHPARLEAIANGWLPSVKDLGTWCELRCVTTSEGGMAVNCYLVWDEVSREAALFDTGWEARRVTQLIAENQLQLRHIFITHAHEDHVAALGELRKLFPKARLHSGLKSGPVDERNRPNDFIHLGSLRITHRETPGHAEDGTTYIVGTWPEDAPHVAIVGDAIFAGSIGRGNQSWDLARQKVREQILTLPPDTLLCPGHGPLTTVAEEKAHNPFF
jgi:hydroxyacylglutathione hydrolase